MNLEVDGRDLGAGLASDPVGRPRVVTFRLRSVYTEAQVREFRDVLGAALDEADPPHRVVVDLAGVDFLSSAALAKLIVLKGRLGREGGDLKLCRLDPQVAHILRIANLTNYFEIYPDVESAFAAFRHRELSGSTFTG
jgi:anti-sigma B factor antagonist